MIKKSFKYEYTPISDNYTNPVEYATHKYDLVFKNSIDAIYTESKIEHFNGNPLIEALPHPRLDTEVNNDCTVMPAFNRELILKSDLNTQ